MLLKVIENLYSHNFNDRIVAQMIMNDLHRDGLNKIILGRVMFPRKCLLYRSFEIIKYSYNNENVYVSKDTRRNEEGEYQVLGSSLYKAAKLFNNKMNLKSSVYSTYHAEDESLKNIIEKMNL